MHNACVHIYIYIYIYIQHTHADTQIYTEEFELLTFFAITSKFHACYLRLTISLAGTV